MIHRIATAIACLLIAGCSATSGAAPAAHSSAPSESAASGSDLVDIGSGLSGPAGTSANVYATGLANVSGLAFDADGRLWAATAAYSDEGDNAVYLVASADSTPTKVIDGLHTPLGLLWIGDTLYVSSESGVDAYSGFDGSAFARTTTVLDLPDGAGEPNGLALSPDGRLVLGISAPCDHCTPTGAYDASVVSIEPDGSDLEVVATGIRAPIGLAYVSGSSDLFVTMNQRDDLGEATPGDWLALVRDGQDWGFPNCFGQGGTACDGAPDPVAVLDRHAAVSGLAIVDGGLAGTSGTSAFAAEWAPGKIVRIDLTAEDGGYTGTAATFLTGLKNPVPVIRADGDSLLVGDWGTGAIYLVTG